MFILFPHANSIFHLVHPVIKSVPIRVDILNYFCITIRDYDVVMTQASRAKRASRALI